MMIDDVAFRFEEFAFKLWTLNSLIAVYSDAVESGCDIGGNYEGAMYVISTMSTELEAEAKKYRMICLN